MKIWRRPLRIRSRGEERKFPCQLVGFRRRQDHLPTAPTRSSCAAGLIFLVLWTPSLEKPGGKRGEVQSPAQPANRVLAGLRAHARGQGQPGDRSAGSQCDGFADRRPDPPRPKGFESFRVLRVQCQGGGGRRIWGEGFSRSQLGNALRFLRERDGAIAIGRGRGFEPGTSALRLARGRTRSARALRRLPSHALGGGFPRAVR